MMRYMFWIEPHKGSSGNWEFYDDTVGISQEMLNVGIGDFLSEEYDTRPEDYKEIIICFANSPCPHGRMVFEQGASLLGGY